MTDTSTRTATFLFTDVEGSTGLLKALRERYGETLAEQQRILREAVGQYGGEEVDTQGDACFFAFGTATDALLSAADAQRVLAEHEWPDGSEVRVRMGVHTGRAELKDGRYLGVAVHRAARISAAAHGGQVLVSHTTRELLEDEEQEAGAMRLRDLGVHRLKDLDRPVRLHQLVAPGLGERFPPPRTGFVQERRRKRRLLAGIAAAVLVAGAAATAFLLTRDEPAPPTIRANSLVRIDPETSEVVSVTKVGRGPFDVAVSGRTVWVLNETAETISLVDTDSGRVRDTIGGLVCPYNIAADGKGGVWALASRERPCDPDAPDVRTLVHFGPTGRPLERHRLPLPGSDLEVGFEAVWVVHAADATATGEDVISKVDPQTGKVRSRRLGFGYRSFELDTGEGAVWVANYGNDTLSVVNPATVRIIREIEVRPESQFVTAAGGHVWVSPFGSSEALRINPSTYQIERYIRVGSESACIDADFDAAWVSNPARRTLKRIDARSGSVVKTMQFPARVHPGCLDVGAGSVWVTTLSPQDV